MKPAPAARGPDPHTVIHRRVSRDDEWPRFACGAPAGKSGTGWPPEMPRCAACAAVPVEQPDPVVAPPSVTAAAPKADDAWKCPKPANGPRTKKEFLGTVLSFAPADDACTYCDHCGESRDAHGKGAPTRPRRVLPT